VSGCPEKAIRLKERAVAPEIPKTAIEMAMKVMQEKGTLERFMHIMQR
jgi:hypothetical protein